MLQSTQPIAEKIRELRRRHGLSQGEFAAIAGVSLPTVSRLERDKETIRLDVLVKMLNALGYDLEIKAKEKTP